MHPIYTLGFHACLDNICPSVAANARSDVKSKGFFAHRNAKMATCYPMKYFGWLTYTYKGYIIDDHQEINEEL